MYIFISLFVSVIFLFSCTPKPPSETPKIASAKRDAFLNAPDFRQALEAVPRFYRFQVASEKEWQQAFNTFQEKYKLNRYTELVHMIGEEHTFWCLEHEIFTPQQAHLAVYKDIEENKLNDLQELLAVIPFSHVKKLQQCKALHTSDLAFLFQNFTQKHPKVHLNHLNQIFGWDQVKYLYFIGAISKTQLRQSMEHALHAYASKDLLELQQTFPFPQLKFLHEEHILSTSRFQRAFYMIGYSSSPQLFDQWIQDFSMENLSYLIGRGIIPSFLARQAFEKDVATLSSLSAVTQKYPISLLSLMENRDALSIDSLKALWDKEMKEATYSHIHKLFSKELDHITIDYLEKRGILNPYFWHTYRLDEKLQSEFKNYSYEVLRVRIFPLPSYLEKHQDKFTLLKKLKGMDEQYQTFKRQWERRQEYILAGYDEKEKELRSQQEKELETANSQKKEEILSRYTYMLKRSESEKTNALGEARKIFEDKLYRLTTQWQTL